MDIVCLDLEGVLLPEIWINFSERTHIEQLRLTTRDISDYDELMKMRLRILEEHRLGIREIQEVIQAMEPLPGAVEFLDDLREQYQIIILSDTFYQFAKPFMRKLKYPTLLCHKLDISEDGRIANYCLRQLDAKRKAVEAIKSLNFNVIAVGDSYNDTTMLAQADRGILFRAPVNVVEQFPEFPTTETYHDLRSEIERSFTLIKQDNGGQSS